MNLKDFKSKLHLLLGWGISFAFIFWLYLTTDWTMVWDELVGSNYSMLLPITLILALHFYLRAFRWRYLLPREEVSKVPNVDLLNSMMLGNFASIILPFRAGEFVRPYVLSLKSSFSFMIAFVSVVVERIFDLAAVLICFAVMVQAVPGVQDWAYQGAKALFVMGLTLVIGTAFATVLPQIVSKIGSKAFSFFPEQISYKLKDLLRKLLDGVTPLRSPSNLAMTFLLTVLVWASSFFYYELGLWMMGIEGDKWMSIGVGVMIALAVAAPSAPGFVGVFQAGTIAGLTLFDVPQSTATAYSILMHIHQLLFVATWGIALLLRGKIDFATLRQAQLHNVG